MVSQKYYDEKYELNINNRLTETLQSVLLYICEYIVYIFILELNRKICF